MTPAGLHVAIIMDGSGRWAERRGWPRTAGHRAGALAVSRTVRAATAQGIGTLTLFAFSAANWNRPRSEAAALMNIFRGYFENEASGLCALGVRLNVIGRRDRLPAALSAAMNRAETATASCTNMRLRLAIDYSARESILEATARLKPARHAAFDELESRFAQTLAEVIHDPAPAAPVDLLIRTGGEQRLSDCLLWDGAFAEIVFSDRLWPDFNENDFAAALEEFRRRDRRFGGIVESAAS